MVNKVFPKSGDFENLFDIIYERVLTLIKHSTLFLLGRQKYWKQSEAVFLKVNLKDFGEIFDIPGNCKRKKIKIKVILNFKEKIYCCEISEASFTFLMRLVVTPKVTNSSSKKKKLNTNIQKTLN